MSQATETDNKTDGTAGTCLLGFDVGVMQFLPVPLPEPAPFREFLDEVQGEMMRQFGVPKEMLETIRRRDGWLRTESIFWQRNEGARE